jgi:hypothetical protein
MAPDGAYPAPLPLSRKAALELLDRLDEFESARGTFLAFVEIPVESRIGEWRFAGASSTLAQAVRQVEEFVAVMGMSDTKPMLQQLLEDHDDTGSDNEYEYPRRMLWTVYGPHRLVLCVRSGAPCEGWGAGIVEVETLAGSGYEGVAPETHPPEPEDDEDDDDEDE